MDENQLKKFLQDNLSISIDVRSWDNSITVSLYVDYTKISESTEYLPEFTNPNA